jgi:hypothetical protein
MALGYTIMYLQELSDSRAHGKEQEMQMNLGMLHDKAECGIKLLGVKQRDKGQDRRKGRCRKHELHHGQITVPLEHTTLELTGKAVKEEKKKEQHDTGPRCTDFITQVVVSKPQIVRRCHKHCDTHTNHQGYYVVVLWVCQSNEASKKYVETESEILRQQQHVTDK